MVQRGYGLDGRVGDGAGSGGFGDSDAVKRGYDFKRRVRVVSWRLFGRHGGRWLREE